MLLMLVITVSVPYVGELRIQWMYWRPGMLHYLVSVPYVGELRIQSA